MEAQPRPATYGNVSASCPTPTKRTSPAGLGKLSEVPIMSRGKGREQRLGSRCRVAFDRPSGPVEAETEDISTRGLFIRTDALLPVGDDTPLRLTLPDGTELLLHGR